MKAKNHWRKVFDSPYLSSADVVEPVILTIREMRVEGDQTKKRKDQMFNTCYFAEPEIRPGEKLKPMIMNVTNSKVLMEHTRSPWIEDWVGTRIEVYVQHGVKFGNDAVDGLRIRIAPEKEWLTPDHPLFGGAVKAYQRDKSFARIEGKINISDDVKAAIMELVNQGAEKR